MNDLLPRDVAIDEPFYSTFGQCEMEQAARLVVALMRIGNEWLDFTREELLELAAAVDHIGNTQGGVVADRRMRVTEYDAVCVRELLDYGWLEQLGDSKLRIKPCFVERLTEREQKRKTRRSGP